MRGLINTLVCLITAAYVIWLKLKILTFHGTLGTKVHQRAITSFNWHASSMHGQLGTIQPKSSHTGHTEKAPLHPCGFHRALHMFQWLWPGLSPLEHCMLICIQKLRPTNSGTFLPGVHAACYMGHPRSQDWVTWGQDVETWHQPTVPARESSVGMTTIVFQLPPICQK